MGKNKKTGTKANAPASASSEIKSTSRSKEKVDSTVFDSNGNKISLREWVANRKGVYYFLATVVFGCVIGFAIGVGVFDLAGIGTQARQKLGNRIRSTTIYQLATIQGEAWEDVTQRFAEWAERVERDLEADIYAKNPSHPRVFAVLREAVIREKNGYIHHDLGILQPAPSGAARGLGMVRDAYQSCQQHCLPGVSEEVLKDRKARLEAKQKNETYPMPDENVIFRQAEVLVRVPLGFQMTRAVALETLPTLIPADIMEDSRFHELDDAALLVLLLAHERGVGRFSRWMPYIASLPVQPSCGYSKAVRPYILDLIHTLREEIGVDVDGWETELLKAGRYAEKIAESLSHDYGTYIKTPDGISPKSNIQWALCQVASRATAGSEKHGALRLVPVLDLINHDDSAGAFIELSGKESMENGDFVDASEDDSGSFVVRSLRHGRRKPLKKGQELLANYNVPHYSPLDWLISLGFVPPERWAAWQKIDPVIPRVRRDGPFNGLDSIEEMWEEESIDILKETDGSEI